jgi:PAS domain S-box-containing protein
MATIPQDHPRVLDRLPVMIRQVGLEGRYYNQAWLEFTGRTLDDEMQSGWPAGIHPVDREHCLETYKKAFAQQEPFQVEYRLQRKDGEFRWLLEVGMPSFSPSGSFTGFLISCFDVSEHKQREEELEAIARISSALRSGNNRSGLLASLLDQVMSLFNAEAAWFTYTENHRGNTLIELGCGQATGFTGKQIQASETISQQLFENGKPFLDNQAIEHQGNLDGIGLTGIAAAPLISSEERVGVLWIGRNREISARELSLLTTIADLSANAIARASLLEQTEKRLQRLAALHTIDLAISASLDLPHTLGVLLEQVTQQLGVDAADVKLLDPHTYTLVYGGGYGFRFENQTRPRSRLSERLAMQAVIDRRFIQIPDYTELMDELGKGPLVIGEEFSAYFAMPLIAKELAKGVLEIYNRTPFYPDTEWLDFFNTLSGQAAIAIDNATLFEGLQRSKNELEIAYDSTLEGWSVALDLRDKETEGHSQRVSELSVALASSLGMNAQDLTYLRWGALLHDIGKMGIPDQILLKAGQLEEDEWSTMRMHPYYAYQMLVEIPYLRPALDIPYCHHEKWDGTGYPRGLKGNEIPIAARIFAVVDVWDALTSNRPYRQAWVKEDALEYIRRQSGKYFDPRVVEAFLKLMENR